MVDPGTRGDERRGRVSMQVASLLLAFALGSCAGTPPRPPGPTRDVVEPRGEGQRDTRDGSWAPRSITGDTTDLRTQLLEVTFPEAVAPALAATWFARETPPPPRVLVAYGEAARELPEAFLQQFLHASDPRLREALAHGLAGGRRGDEATLRSLLRDEDARVRAAGVVALTRSPLAADANQTFAEELGALPADLRAVLDLAPLAPVGDDSWPPAVQRWVEARHLAGRAFGLVAGAPFTAHLLRRLAGNRGFLAALLLMDLDVGLPADEQDAAAAALTPDLPTDVLGNVLAELGARALVGRAQLDAVWGRALRDVLLSPWQREGAALAIHGLLPRLAGTPWAAVVGELDQESPGPRSGFGMLSPDDARAACILVGRLGGARALALLKAWQHGDESVQRHLMAARVMAGENLTSLSAWFAPFPTLALDEQLSMLELLARTGVAARHAALLQPFLAVRDPEIAMTIVLTTWREGDPRAAFLRELVLREETERWRGRAAAILLRLESPPPRLLEFVRVSDAEDLLLEWAAWEVRLGSVTGIGFLQAALQNLDDAGSMLAARELRSRTGVMGLEDLLLAGLQRTADPLVRARLGWLLGELGSERVMERLPERDPALDPAFGAALFGQALQAARKDAGK